jgi:hypothetical protein
MLPEITGRACLFPYNHPHDCGKQNFGKPQLFVSCQRRCETNCGIPADQHLRQIIILFKGDYKVWRSKNALKIIFMFKNLFSDLPSTPIPEKQV